MFLVDADNPGWRVGDRMRTIDAGTAGGHCRVHLRDARVADDAVLGEPGTRVRLRAGAAGARPADPLHALAGSGAARPRRGPAAAAERELFGAPLGSLGLAQQLIADNEIELAASRALLAQAVGQVAAGAKGTEESSRAKVFISEATGRIVDRAVQLAGRGRRHRGVGDRPDLRRHPRLPHLRRPLRSPPRLHRPQGAETSEGDIGLTNRGAAPPVVHGPDRTSTGHRPHRSARHGFASPKLLRREPRPFGQRLELSPSDRRVDDIAPGKGGEPAV